MLEFSDIPNTRWAEFKNEIQRRWDRLTADEVERTAGDVRALWTLIAERYDLHSDEARGGLEAMVAAFRRDDHLESAEVTLENERTFRDKFRQF